METQSIYTPIPDLDWINRILMEERLAEIQGQDDPTPSEFGRFVSTLISLNGGVTSPDNTRISNLFHRAKYPGNIEVTLVESKYETSITASLHHNSEIFPAVMRISAAYFPAEPNGSNLIIESGVTGAMRGEHPEISLKDCMELASFAYKNVSQPI